jgi:hypothetical protein
MWRNLIVAFMRILSVIVSLLALSAPVQGHHSNNGIDRESLVEIQGIVTEFRWRNPHIYVVVERSVAGDDPQQWQFEIGAIPVLVRSGWTPESLVPGEPVTIRGYPDKNPERQFALLKSIEKADGVVLSQCSTYRPQFPDIAHCDPLEGGENESASNFSGIWQPRGWLGDGFGALKPTDKGIEARNKYDPDRDTPTALCIGYPLIQNLAGRFYLNQIQIDESANTISIRSEFFDSIRTVHMDERDDTSSRDRTLNGYSIGRWVDDTLIVETTRFAEHQSPYGSSSGIPSGPDKRVEERYTLSEDGTAMFIDVRLEDPDYLKEPFESRVEWSYAPKLKFHRYECDADVAAHFRSE